MVKISGSPVDDANSFVLDSPIIINDIYVEKGDFITIIKSKRDDDKKDKSDNDDDTDKKNEADKEDKKEKEDDTVDLEIEEKVIIGNKYMFEPGDKIRIFPKSKNTISRLNNHTFKLNEDLIISGHTIKENSLIEVLPKEKIMMGERNLLRGNWV